MRAILLTPRTPRRIGLRLTSAFLLGVGLLFSALNAPAQSIEGDEPQPSRPSTNLRFQPKIATWSTEIVPAEAQPGQTVTFRVSAEIDPGYHLYELVEEQPQSEGPRYTEFDFFQTAGLIPQGDWSPDREPIRQKEPAFPTVDAVVFFEDQVTWSLQLQVPDDAKAGERTLKLQAGYMLCNDQVCTRPGQWVLPEARLTVLEADSEPDQSASETRPTDASSESDSDEDEAVTDPSEQPVASESTVDESAPEAPTAVQPEPAKPNTNPRFKPRQVRWFTAITPSQAKPGDLVRFDVRAEIDPGYHLYAYVEEQPQTEGPKYTEFDLYNNGGLDVVRNWTPDAPPISQKEPVFPSLDSVSFHEDQVTWSVYLQVPEGADAGDRTIQVQAGYMVCDDQTCSRPGQWALDPVQLAVLSDDANVVTQSVSLPADPLGNPIPAEGGGDETIAIADSSASRASTGVRNQAQEAIDAGFLPFLFTCALGGLATLLMPCVWPMIPITINFFVKQQQKAEEQRKAFEEAQKQKNVGQDELDAYANAAEKPKTGYSPLLLASIYSLSIMAIFTTFGLIAAAVFGERTAQLVANNPYVNIFIAVIFVLFGLSLLGVFEFRLPSFLLNASAKGEQAGGLISIIFMALTLTITSFTCTFPIVGGLLVIAAKGSFLYPIVGMLVFSGVLALPFFAFAMAPNMVKALPKGGDWMNTVKVVGGLIEIGAALKFINVAETAYVDPSEAITDAQFTLSAWVMLTVVCGLYVLGMFRYKGDSDSVHIGPGRLLVGSFLMVLALYVSPALFGNPPESYLYKRLVVGLLPADAGELEHSSFAGGGAGLLERPEGRSTEATSSDPAIATRQQDLFHGVLWDMSYEEGQEKAKAQSKPILLDFTGVNCANCRQMEQEVFSKAEVIDRFEQFVTVSLYTDRVPIASITQAEREALAEANFELELELTNDTTQPLYVAVTPDGEFLNARGGYMPTDDFLEFLDESLDLFEQSQTGDRVAQAK